MHSSTIVKSRKQLFGSKQDWDTEFVRTQHWPEVTTEGAENKPQHKEDNKRKINAVIERKINDI